MFKKRKQKNQPEQQKPAEKAPEKQAPKKEPKFCDDLKPGRQVTVCACRLTVIAVEADSVIFSNSGTPVEWKKSWLEACPDKRK